LKFESISITLPTEVEEIYNALYSISSNTFIAGGFVCDQILGYPFKDVDIFVDANRSSQVFDFFRKRGCPLRSVVGEYEVFMTGERGVYEFTYKGTKFQLIFQSIGLEILNYFDVRFRECYYQNGEAFISKDALRDMENKELNVGIVRDSDKTLYRLVRFEKKYGFSISDLCIDRMKSYLDVQSSPSYSKRFASMCIEENELSKRFIEIIDDSRPISQSLIEKVSYLKDNKYKVKRDLLERIFEHEGKAEKKMIHVFSENPFLKFNEEIADEIKNTVKIQSTKLLFHYPEYAALWRNNIDNPTYLHTLFPKEIDHLLRTAPYSKNEGRDILTNLNSLFKKMELNSHEALNFPKELELKFSSDSAVFKDMDVERYLKDGYTRVDIKDKGYIVLESSSAEYLFGNIRPWEVDIYLPVISPYIKETTALSV